jgi:hypothetical protein
MVKQYNLQGLKTANIVSNVENQDKMGAKTSNMWERY